MEEYNKWMFICQYDGAHKFAMYEDHAKTVPIKFYDTKTISRPELGIGFRFGFEENRVTQ